MGGGGHGAEASLRSTQLVPAATGQHQFSERSACFPHSRQKTQQHLILSRQPVPEEPGAGPICDGDAIRQRPQAISDSLSLLGETAAHDLRNIATAVRGDLALQLGHRAGNLDQR